MAITGTSSGAPVSELQVKNVKIQNVVTPIVATDMHQSWFDRIQIVSSIASAVMAASLAGAECKRGAKAMVANPLPSELASVTHIFNSLSIAKKSCLLWRLPHRKLVCTLRRPPRTLEK